MADAKYTVELGVQSNKQEFDRINKELNKMFKYFKGNFSTCGTFMTNTVITYY